MSKTSKRYVRCATCGKKLYNDFYFWVYDPYCSEECMMDNPAIERVDSADELIDRLYDEETGDYFDADGYKLS